MYFKFQKRKINNNQVLLKYIFKK